MSACPPAFVALHDAPEAQVELALQEPNDAVDFESIDVRAKSQGIAGVLEEGPAGKVLVIGEPGAELYSPGLGTFSALFVNRTRQLHTATLLSDGSVLIAGRQITDITSSAELLP